MVSVVVCFLFLGSSLASANEFCSEGVGSCAAFGSDASAMLQGVAKLNAVGEHQGKSSETITRKDARSPPVSGGGSCVDMCASFAADMGWSAVCAQAGPDCSACKDCGGSMIATNSGKMTKREDNCVDMCASFAADMGWETICAQAGPDCSACKGCGGSKLIAKASERVKEDKDKAISGGGSCVGMCASFAADMGWSAVCAQAGPDCSACKDCGGSLIATASGKVTKREDNCVDMCASFAADMGWEPVCAQAGPDCSACKGCGGSKLIAKASEHVKEDKDKAISGGGSCVGMCASFAADMGWETVCAQAGPDCSACKDCGGSLIATATGKVTNLEDNCVDMCASFAADMGWETVCAQAGPDCSACKGCGGSE